MATVAGEASSGFEQYTADVYGWAYRLLGRHHDALDVVQDVFVRWDAQCSKDPPRQPRGWLRRVTLNRAIDFRRMRNEAGAQDQSDGEGLAIDRASSPKQLDARLDGDQLRSDIATALDRLTEVQRSVLVAKVYDGVTFAELAKDHSLSPSTVKTHYLRAVRAVRDRLSRRWDQEEKP